MDSESSDDVPIGQLAQRAKQNKKTEKTSIVKDEAESSDDIPLSALIKAKKAKTAKTSAVKDEDESSDDVPLATLVKNIKKRSSEGKSSAKSRTSAPKKTKKEKNDADDDQDAYKWWLDEPLPEGKKWRTLEHNGVLFAPPYVPHKVPLVYDGKPIVLDPESEELATFYAMYIESDHVKKAIFNRNFFDAFRESLPKNHVVKKFELCDFRKIRAHLMDEKEAKKNRSKAEKDQDKEDKAAEKAKYGFALIDGHKQPVANYLVEPPGLFLGRGEHPKTGCVKKRMQPEDVTINIGKGAPVPPVPVPGHKWGSVIHNDEVTWLAHWKESINGGSKYVWLGASSRLKGEADRAKYEKARELARKAPAIRRRYTSEMASDNGRIRQRATALWMIDVLALRVGNEKGEDEADTYGACSLLVEHVETTAPNVLKLSFLGKDSMPYENECEVPIQVYRNVNEFCKGKKPSDSLFDLLSTTALNSFLKQLMPGLTAKVFRTYNASYTLEQELAKAVVPDNATVEDKLLIYNAANRAVAILCNHQRTVPKTFDDTRQRLQDKLDHVKSEKKFYVACQKYHKSGGAAPKPPKPLKEDAKPLTCPKDAAATEKRIKTYTARIRKLEAELQMRDDNKTIALGTSKLNYMDPRISVAWCKKVDMPIDRIYAKTLRQKFPWALDEPATWKFFSGKEEKIASPSSSQTSSSSSRSRTPSQSSPARKPTKKRLASEAVDRIEALKDPKRASLVAAPPPRRAAIKGRRKILDSSSGDEEESEEASDNLEVDEESEGVEW